MNRTVKFYVTPEGKIPVKEFLDAIQPRDAQKIIWVLRLLEDPSVEMEHIPRKYFKKLVGTEGIWEVRVKTGTGCFRVFSFFITGNEIVLTHGYMKKTDKTDIKQLRRAERYRAEFLLRQDLYRNTGGREKHE